MRKKNVSNGAERSVNAEIELRNTVGGIFEDIVILDKRFAVACVGINICNLLRCEEKKMVGLPFSNLTGESILEDELCQLPETGFFRERQVLLINSLGEGVSFIISGFYLGLIADCNELIVLKFKFVGDLKEKQLAVNPMDLDDFMYNTSHKLRGPLATLKGLINLLKMDQIDLDKEFIINQMSFFTNRLDDRLHKLIYFAQSDKEMEFSKGKLPLNFIIERLRDYEDPDNISQKVVVKEYLPESLSIVENGQMILVLLQNVKSFFCRNCKNDCEMSFRVSNLDNYLVFEFVGSGLTLCDEQQQKINIVNIGYTEILKDPEFTELYSAKKITLKLNGSLHISVMNQKTYAYIRIPRKSN
jgi:hypothetical protein